jgi:4-oxalocrotonate tautomerase
MGPLIDVHVIENTFTPEQKRQMIERLTDAMVSVEGEKVGHRRQADDD